ncbi:MAG TPA: MATE family efflux transporter [Gemmatimonadaceae bacterium]|nr:MATE family efflux transporter [Gemmatimonadaceae bacterium]
MSRLAELRPTRGELREMVRLASPVVLAQVGIMLMGVVDTAMVGRVSPATIAAVALGHIYWVNVTIPGIGILLVLDPVVSQAVGAKDPEGVARGVQRGVLLALVMSVPTALLLIPGEFFLNFLRQPAEVAPIAATFARWSIMGVVPFYLFVVFRQSLQAMAAVRPVVLSIVVANIVNAALNWVLIYGHFGLPALGAVGSAISTVVSRFLMLAMLITLGWHELHSALVPWRKQSWLLAPMRRMVRIGLPVGFQQWLEIAVFAFGAVTIGWFGAVPLAGHEVALNLAALTFMVPMGIAAAAAAMVGRAIGRRDLAAARRDAVAAIAVGVGFMSLAALAFLLFPRSLARLFVSDPDTVAMASSLIAIGGLFQVFDGIQGVVTGVLRGTGDTRIPMLLHLGGFWGIGIPLSLVLAFGLHMGPPGVWWGFVGSLATVATVQLLRVRWRLAQDIQRLRIDETQEYALPT